MSKYVIFDLDLTLAFPLMLPLEQLFGYKNRFTGLDIDADLSKSLERVEGHFMKQVLDDKSVRRLFFRPNLREYLYPVWIAKRSGIVKKVCIYSNSWSPFSVNFAKNAIEEILDMPDLFDVVLDATDRIRDTDWASQRFPRRFRDGDAQPVQYKRMRTIHKMLKDGDIDLEDILFVDDNEHSDINCVYYKAAAFYPEITAQIVSKIMNMVVKSLERENLLTFVQYVFARNIDEYRTRISAHKSHKKSISYILSGIFDTDTLVLKDNKVYIYPVNSIADLFNFIRESYKDIIEDSRGAPEFKSDTNDYLNMLFPFLSRGTSARRIDVYVSYLRGRFKPAA